MMAIDATTVILTAVCTGIGISIGNALYDAFLKDYFKSLKRHKKKIIALKKKVFHYKRPWLAALLNFLIWGLGYFYVGRRRVRGIILFMIQLFIIGAFSLNQNDLKTVFESLSYSFLTIIVSLYLSFDAYRLAHTVNEDK